MKVGLATTLSVAGVLAAGAAAFAVNSSVLSGTSDVAVGLPATSNSDRAKPAGDTSGASLSNISDPLSGSSGARVQSEPSSSSNGSVTTYSVGDAGSVVIDTSSGSIMVRDIVPNTGWTAEPPMPLKSGGYKIHFTKGSTRIELRITMLNGKPHAVMSDDSGSSTPPAFTPNTPKGTTDTLPSYLNGDDDHNDDDNGNNETHDTESHGSGETETDDD